MTLGYWPTPPSETIAKVFRVLYRGSLKVNRTQDRKESILEYLKPIKII